MIVLGINAFHADAAAALFCDGALVAAAEEERFTGVKHWAGFPSNAVSFCLAQGNLSLATVDHVAVNQNTWASAFRRLAYLARERPSCRLVMDRLRNRKRRRTLSEHFAQAFPGQTFRARVHGIEHHVAHLASAFFVSPFDEALVASVDGFGDFSSAAWGRGSGTRISVKQRIHFPHSLGIFYQALTQYLGFPHYGDEYKVMGLAPYGEPRFASALRQLVRSAPDGLFTLNLDFFRHHRVAVAGQWDGGAPVFGDLFTPALESLLGPRRTPLEPLTDRHRDIAASAQHLYEETFFRFLNAARHVTGLSELALAGGCAMNSVANGKIADQAGFGRQYVPPAAGDAGGAIGAALTVWHRLGGRRGQVMRHANWGPAFGPKEIGAVLARNAVRLDAVASVQVTIDDESELCRRIAALVAQGAVVGWFQGRMEWGPRALGNRSILGDPRRSDMKDRINAKIKRRESFRPFAPSVLIEHAAEWFEGADDVPFMTQVLPVRPEQRALIPAVTHVDGSGRLQTVSRDANPRYYRLIESFAALTGVPLILNTSFNENEPMVRAPEQALECFLRTEMDAVVLGDVLIARPGILSDLETGADGRVRVVTI